MIKAVFFDVDGTLTSLKDHKVPGSTKEAISILKKKGIRCFMATGRHPLELEEIATRDIPFDGYITTNGQICFDGKGEMIYSDPFEKTVREKLVKLFAEKTLPLLFIERDRMYHNFIDERVISAYGLLGTSIPPVDIYKGDDIYQACTYIRHGDTSYHDVLPAGVKTMWWRNDAIDIISENGGKVAGIKAILQTFGIDRSETMAFGDAENDRDMLLYVDKAVVMGNGDPKIKALADYVTADVDADGIYKALQHFGLID